MNRMRSSRGTGTTAAENNEKHYFAIVPILLNIITIVLLGGVYYYIVTHQLFPDYQNYIYWTINVLISYNILVASARSIWAPMFSLLLGAGGIFVSLFFVNSDTTIPVISYLTSAQCWQLIVLGVAGLLITFALRL
jgi:hypothetical protein